MRVFATQSKNFTKLLSQVFTATLCARGIKNASASNDSTNNRVDFTGISGVDRVYAYLKERDSRVAATLLKATPLFSQATSTPRHMVDIGGANGWMAWAFQQSLNVPLISHVIEPSNDHRRTDEYIARAKQSHGQLKVASVIRQKVENPNCTIPSVDLVLASHSLYYNRSDWFLNRDFNNHLLTKLFRSIRPNGVLCVILQSKQPTQRIGKYGELFNHEQLEDHIYPLIDKVPHSHNNHYANSQMFELTLDHYQKMFIYRTGNRIPWTVIKDTAITEIPLGEINAVPDKSGNYQQTENVHEILTFYLKGQRLNTLAPETQRKVITLLNNHCQTVDGRFVVIHVNDIYAIIVSKVLHDELQKSSTADPQNHLLTHPHL